MVPVYLICISFVAIGGEIIESGQSFGGSALRSPHSPAPLLGRRTGVHGTAHGFFGALEKLR